MADFPDFADDDCSWRSRGDITERIRDVERWIAQAKIDRAILFGHEGHPGRIASVEVTVRTLAEHHGGRLSSIETWRISLTARIATGIAIGTPIAGILTTLVIRWLNL